MFFCPKQSIVVIDLYSLKKINWGLCRMVFFITLFNVFYRFKVSFILSPNQFGPKSGPPFQVHSFKFSIILVALFHLLCNYVLLEIIIMSLSKILQIQAFKLFTTTHGKKYIVHLKQVQYPKPIKPTHKFLKTFTLTTFDRLISFLCW